MTAALVQDSRARLLPAGFLALGTFAIGTEGFMIAPLLPVMAEDFALAVPTVALLVIVFTLARASSSPIAIAATGRMARKQVRLLATALFARGSAGGGAVSVVRRARRRSAKKGSRGWHASVHPDTFSVYSNRT